MPDAVRRDGSDDPVHKKLCRAIERRQRSYLWTPADAISFVPRVLPIIYGDGRALFTLATTNQRPAYWVIRACSTWWCGLDTGSDAGPNFGDFTDDILTDLEEAFGSGRCGYSGNSLFWPKRDRILNCQCEECTDRYVARWPMVDGEGGCSWSRINWPAGFETVLNPLSKWIGNLLATTEIAEADHA
ncbi:hypothetical protein [Prosthecomicrobium hirschii]|uniref:hypothetical protein n=1 Tax=Prosthecodimorpha hirschii TaxID=665126 RepID=UPI00221FFCBF|nr:hypothetical protein [Prosthecomicrobium hirschii]MCW1839483.1 hypothetical protein [Prosthecomicrobium hirschii]